METPETAAWKTRERQSAAARRAAAHAALPEAGTALAARFHENVHLPRGAGVSGYWPLDGELDVRPLLHQIHQAGHPLGHLRMAGQRRVLGAREFESSFGARGQHGDRGKHQGGEGEGGGF